MQLVELVLIIVCVHEASWVADHRQNGPPHDEE